MDFVPIRKKKENQKSMKSIEYLLIIIYAVMFSISILPADA